MDDPVGDQRSVISTSRPGVRGFDAIGLGPILAELVELVAFVLSVRGVGDGDVDLHVVDAGEMAALNAEHLGGEGPTDVLAFPLDEPGERAEGADCAPMIGDIVLCPAVAAERRCENGIDDEYRLLVVHATLHLLGLDHSGDHDRIEMQSTQHELLEAWADRNDRQRPRLVELPGGRTR